MVKPTVLVALALVLPIPAFAQGPPPIEVDGSLDSLDEIIAVVTTLLEPVPDDVQSPTSTEPMAGPSRVWAGAVYLTDIDVRSLAPPTIGAEDPAWFHHVPADFAYYGTDTSFVAYQVVVETGTDWQDAFPYFEVGIGLAKPGLAGAVAMPGIDNDPFAGAERSNSYVWVGGDARAVTGFAQSSPGMNLFQSAYVTSGTPLGDTAYAVTMLIPDPTFVPRFVVSWGDGVDIGSVGFVAIEGEALGTQDPLLWNPAEAAQVVTAFGALVAGFEAGDAGEGSGTGDDPPPANDAEPPSEGEEPTTEDTAQPTGDAPGPTNDTTGDAAGGTASAAEEGGAGPWVFIIGGFVLVVIAVGGVWYLVWGNRGTGTEVVRPTAGEDRTGGELTWKSDDTKVPLESAHLLSEQVHGGLPPGAPLSEIGSLLTRAEALGLPKTADGWQLLEFDLAWDILAHDEVEIAPAEPGQPPRRVSRWDQLAPPGTPIDGNQVGIWFDPVQGVRVGTPDDPHAFVTPPEHALPPKLDPEDTEPLGIGFEAPTADAGEAKTADEPPLAAGLEPTTHGEEPWWGDGPPPVGPRDTAPTVGPSTAPHVVTPDDDPYGTLEGLDAVDMSLRPATVALLGYGETGIEADKLGRLEDIIRRFRGTGDIAGVAQALFDFNVWHSERFGEPWFEWTNDAGDDTLVGASSVDGFFMARRMCCFEFVHFCAYIASDQLARPRMGRPGEQVGEAPSWGLVPRVFRVDAAVSGGDDAPKGWAITGVARGLAGVNTAGYTHIVVSLGNGEVIGLGTAGLEKESVEGCFDSWKYKDLEHGPYDYGARNPAPAGGGG